MMICPKCRCNVPDDSVFCPFCRQSLIHDKQKYDAKWKKKFILVVSLIVAIIVFLTYKWQVCENELISANQTLQETRDELLHAEIQISSLEADIENKEDVIYSQIRENRESVLTAGEYDDLIEYLRSSSSTNGIISTDNKIYCVKKGGTTTIKINWPQYEATQYAGTRNGDLYISAEWNDDSNLVVTGKKPGVEMITFSSDGNKKNTFNIVVVCYEK